MKTAASTRKLYIAIPFYKNEQLVEPLLRSLAACADDLAAIDAEILLYNDSPAYPALGAALALNAAMPGFPTAPSVLENPRNLGFVGTMNLAIDRAVRDGRDLLILNSDTIVFPGAFAEMVRVSRIDPMTGFVCPRSNNATKCSLPHQFEFADIPPAEAYANFQILSPHLPRFSYAPTGVGFCMLIRWSVLAEFGGFDPIYGGGYNEENDLVSRAGRVGYRAVFANHAFVWHKGEQSFGASDQAKAARELVNRKILLQRYPEYARNTDAYETSPAYKAEKVLAGLLPDASGKRRIAFDFSSFGTHHNGTFEAAKRLVEEANRAWRDAYDVAVICSKPVWDFHALGANARLSRYEILDEEPFAAVIRIGQPYDWPTLERLARQSPVVAISMLDTISHDCAHLYDPAVEELWAFVAEHTDVVLSISKYSMKQFETRFDIAPEAVRCASLLSVNVADYAPGPAAQGFAEDAAGAIMVVGNHFAHKYVKSTLDKLLEALPEERFMVLGVEHDSPRVFSYHAGMLSDGEIAALYASCKYIIFPSHYEGFGLPLMHALANRKPIWLREMGVYREILDAMGGSANAHFYETTADLIAALRSGARAWVEEATSNAQGWPRAARDLRAAIEQGLKDVRFSRITSRFRALHLREAPKAVADLAPVAVGPDYRPREEIAADAAGALLRRAAARALRVPGVYRLVRSSARIARVMRSALRPRR